MSGSLLGVELKGIASAPVGCLSILRMYPMDFGEFKGRGKLGGGIEKKYNEINKKHPSRV